MNNDFSEYVNMNQLQSPEQVIGMIKTSTDNIDLLEELFDMKVEEDPAMFLIHCFYASGEDRFTDILASLIDRQKRLEVVKPILNEYREKMHTRPWIKDPDAIYEKYGADQIYQFFMDYARGNTGFTIEDLEDAGPKNTYWEDVLKVGRELKKRVLTLIMADLADSIMMRICESEDMDVAQIKRVLNNAE